MNKRTMVLAAILVVAVVLLAVAIGWNPSTDKGGGTSTGRKVVIVGVDGLDWFLMGRMLQARELPTLNGLVRRSLTGEVAAERPVLPDVGWTVLGSGRALSDEDMLAVSGTDGRLFGRLPAIARLVGESGGRALTVGWPGSWPLDASASLSVAPYRSPAPAHELGLPAAILDASPLSASADVASRVEVALARNNDILEEEFSRIVFDGRTTDDGWSQHLLALRWSLLADMTALDLAASLMADEGPDLTMVCLGGPDAAVHRFLAAAEPEFFGEPVPGSDRYADVLRSYYAFMDAGLERLRRLTDEDTVFIVCSAYGTHPSLDVAGAFASHDEGPPGVLLAHCVDVQQRPQPIQLSAVDLAPTVLAALGMNIPTDMDGRVIQPMVPAGTLQERPLSYAGSSAAQPVSPTPADLRAMDVLANERLSRLTAAMAQ